MSWVATAVIGGAVVGAGASIYAGGKAASATKKAAQTASNTELQMYNQSRADLAPYRQAGYGALDMLTSLYGIPAGPSAGSAPVSAYTAGMSRIGDANTQYAQQSLTGGMQTGGPYATIGDAIVGGKLDPRYPTSGGAAPPAGAPATGYDLTNFYKSPDYDFRMREGLAGIGNSYAARGAALSGPEMRASGRFAADLGSGSFNDYVNRLASIAGIGQTATTNTAQLGAGTAGNLSNIYTQAGAQRASTYGRTAAGVNNAVQGGLQNWFMFDYLKNSGGSGGIPV